MDLSFPQKPSVNDGIPSVTYLGDQFKLRLPGIDRLVEFIRTKGRNCLVFKKDLRRAYRQFPVDPKDYSLLGFFNQEKFYSSLWLTLIGPDLSAHNSSGHTYLQRMFTWMTFMEPNIHLLLVRRFRNLVNYFNNLV